MLITAVFFAGYGWGYKDGDAARRERLFEELITLIEATVTPEMWDDVGGSGAVGTGGRIGGCIRPPDDHPFNASPCGPANDDPFSENPFE